jgi:hypothetical protein
VVPAEHWVAAGAKVHRLEPGGQLKLEGKRWQLCGPLSGEPVQVMRIEQRALVFYRRTLLRELDLSTGANHAVECR